MCQIVNDLQVSLYEVCLTSVLGHVFVIQAGAVYINFKLRVLGQFKVEMNGPCYPSEYKVWKLENLLYVFCRLMWSPSESHAFQLVCHALKYGAQQFRNAVSKLSTHCYQYSLAIQTAKISQGDYCFRVMPKKKKITKGQNLPRRPTFNIPEFVFCIFAEDTV